MLKKVFFAAGLFFSVTVQAQADKSQLPFWNYKLSFEARVNDLVGRLTLEEKVKQMLNHAPAIPRLDIPAYDWWSEVLHGVARTPYHTTVYPQAIAMAATWDTAALYTMADQSAREGRAIHNKATAEGKNGDSYVGLTYWTPNINIFRDPRWGRGQETYGEDPFLTAMLGKAFVRGLQGEDPKYLKAAACAKHYAIHSGPEATRHSFDVDVSDYDLWNTYLPAFKELVTHAKVAGVMCAYNAFRKKPCCGNDLLMTDILRRQWNFNGYVTSDCGAIEDFFNYHKTHPNAEAAAIDAVTNGTDVECGNRAYLTLTDAVKTGRIAEKEIDRSVKRLFMIRMRLGMFDPASMVSYAQTPASVLESAPHKAQALKMAQESIVLLKNENHLLPLSKSIKKIAVVGPNADNSIAVLGNYNGTPSKIVTALDGIKTKLGKDAAVTYEKAVNFTNAMLPGGKTDFAALADRVKAADVIVFIGGISPQLEGEEMKVNEPGFNSGDRTTILLPAAQTEAMKALKATGKPVVFVMMTGSALAMPWEQENIPAIVNAWYGGQAAGTAIADVLFGDYNPSGRLPVTFYKSDADLPAFDDYRMENRTYRYFSGQALYPFGYGLSYTTFRYEGLKVPTAVKNKAGIPVSVQLSNAGTKGGEEVVQLYISYQGQSIKKPLKALKGFQRVWLNAGQTKIIKFLLTPDALAIAGEDGKLLYPKGRLRISVGGGQPDVNTPATSNVVSRTVTIN
ncbi:MAG: glycoside hydrolase family 3 C-terminal domain-containing protein [Niabella sp.]|nr:glycoside hydrolase family 3 C-terminal domain-containing protein [Niabella sp.]